MNMALVETGPRPLGVFCEQVNSHLLHGNIIRKTTGNKLNLLILNGVQKRK